jgi:TolB-like protein/Flp pilus assembly protein TadD
MGTMSRTEPLTAVFLSYASQDAQAARRICEALRENGIEVWFDQSELRGGDAWDRKIRGQIRDCALFVPLISANTASRLEGYFRLEWKLAVDRTHLMAAERTFLLPVVIDAIDEAKAFVPDEFRIVQWTRALDGQVPAGFEARVARLLSQYTGDVSAETSSKAGASPARAAPPPTATPVSARLSRRGAMIGGGVVVVAAALFVAGRMTHAPAAPAGISVTSAVRPDAAAGSAGAADKSIAVLPFADLSEKKDQEYFADGLAEEILDQIAKVPGVHVIARTSSFTFRGKSEDIPTIARQLNVANILEGSVRKSGNHLRVTTELVRGKDGENFWSETYDRELKDVFQVQDEITSAVVAALKVSLMGTTPRAMPTTNTDAYTTFLKCLAAAQLESRDSTYEAAGLCRRSVELDPNFAPGWDLLGSITRAQYVAFGEGSYPKNRDEAYGYMQKAIALDPKFATAHVSLANLYYQMDFNLAAASEELKKATEMEPANANTYWTTGYIADTEGRYEEALQNFRRSRELDPLGIDINVQIGNTYYRAGKLSDAAKVFQQIIALQPAVGSVHYRLGLVHLRQGDAATTLVDMQQEPDSDFHSLGVAMALYALGRYPEADEALATAKRTVTEGAAYQVAIAYAARRDTEQTLKWLEHAFDIRDAGMLWIKGDPLLEFVRGEPRFQVLLAKMHFG